ncbi:MAG: hypothetical protein ACLFV7_10005 [Phycisphaerae bacterium]
MREFMTWLWFTDGGLAVRIVAGVSIFAVLAAVELIRKGRDARRWKEYLFLLYAVCLAMAYGAINDLVTVSISWEYFYFGKNLAEEMGYLIPPDFAALRIEAVKIGLMASWTAGLMFGVAALFANNPRGDLPRLPTSTLVKLGLLPVAAAGVVAILSGLAGWHGMYDRFMPAGMDLIRHPRYFTAVWGAHLGAYFGGAGGMAAAVILILMRRRRLQRERLPSAC